MKFRWEGFTAKGEEKIGEIEAENESVAAGLLRTMGIMTQNIQPDDGQPFKSVFPNPVYQQPEAAYPIDDRRNLDQGDMIAKGYEGLGFSGIPGPSVQMECMNCHGTGKMGNEVCSHCNGKPHRAKPNMVQREPDMLAADPSKYWQINLRKNLADIQIVMDFVRNETPAHVNGSVEAEMEMNKQAIIKAFKEMR